MKDIKKVTVFDFDGTLIYTAESSQENRDKVFDKYGYNGRGWWSRKESLDVDIFYPTKNEWIVKKYEEAKADPNTIVILMTGRLIQLEGEVQKILEFHGLKFDRIHCNTGGDTYTFKLRKFEALLREFAYAELTMYDDRTEHVLEFQKWAPRTKRVVNIIHVQ